MKETKSLTHSSTLLLDAVESSRNVGNSPNLDDISEAIFIYVNTKARNSMNMIQSITLCCHVKNHYFLPNLHSLPLDVLGHVTLLIHIHSFLGNLITMYQPMESWIMD
jgi:hypothetical protein